jgi:hypothetical protein
MFQNFRQPIVISQVSQLFNAIVMILFIAIRLECPPIRASRINAWTRPQLRKPAAPNGCGELRMVPDGTLRRATWLRDASAWRAGQAISVPSGFQ